MSAGPPTGADQPPRSGPGVGADAPFDVAPTAHMPQPPGPGPAARPAHRHLRPTVRLRLTLWYSGLFLLAGILLLTLNYVLVRQSLVDAPAEARAAVAERLGIDREELEPPPREDDAPPPDARVLIGGMHFGDVIREVQQELNDETLRRLLLMSGVALAVVMALSVGLGWVMAGRMLRPLHQMTETARHLSEATLPSQRIALEGPHDELKELADTFDAMLARLDAAFAAQKDFVANASHELRTPLTIIRTEIDVALDDPHLSREELEAMGDAVLDAVSRSEALIDRLLVLARAEGSVAHESVDLAEIAGEVAAHLAAMLDDAGLRIHLDLRPARLTGDPALLDRLVANLLDNAARHNVAKGWVRMTTAGEGRHVSLVVANSGPAIAPAEVERLFERFYRPDRSRSRKTGGFGLGLSIVRSVAEAHGGTANALPLPEGGLEVTVDLPATQAGSTPPRSPRTAVA